ncbi:MAG: hypothetical protein LBB85_02955, partial [Dysgonamonadaceae bacterium]|nr:hypothetical protein [Dysgonamonadaceae bacterium]
MKRPVLFFQWILGVFCVLLPSCVDHDYDLTDENIDKEAVFSPNGFNAPLGNIDTLFIGNELRKFLADKEIEVRTDPNSGVFYVEYTGEFPVEFPEYTVPVFEEIETERVDIEEIIPNAWEGRYPISFLLPSGQTIPIVSDKHASYNLEKPYFRTPKEGLEVSIDRTYFNNCKLTIMVYLSNLQFSGTGAEIRLSMDFPDNFIFRDHPQDPVTGKTHIEQVVNVAEFAGNYRCIVTNIANLEFYAYQVEDVQLDYNVQLHVTQPTNVSITDTPQFHMDFAIDNSNVSVEYVTGAAKGVETISGSIATGDFTDAFKENILAFRNPSLHLNLQTNLRSDFNMDMTFVSKKENNSEIATASISDLEYNKLASNAMNEANYVLSPQVTGVDYWKEFALNTLFTEIPHSIAYELNANFDDDNVILYPEGLTLSVAYTLKLPFDFDEL